MRKLPMIVLFAALVTIHNTGKAAECQSGRSNGCPYAESSDAANPDKPWGSSYCEGQRPPAGCGVGFSGTCQQNGATIEQLGVPVPVDCCYCRGGANVGAYKAGNSKGLSTFGEVHITTAGGLLYHFQAIGEFLLATDNKSFVAQVRKEKYKDTNGEYTLSVNTALAIGLGTRRVAFHLWEMPHLRVDGVPSNEDYVLVDDAEVFSGPNYARVAIRDGMAFDIYFNPDHMNIVATPPFGGVANLTGLLGHGEGDVTDELRTRDGLTEVRIDNPSWEELYGVFGESYRISQEESLFDDMPGRDVAHFTDRMYPPTTFDVFDLRLIERANAELACRRAGVSNQFLLQACMIDVAVFDTESATAIYEYVPPPHAMARVTGGIESETTKTLRIHWLILLAVAGFGLLAALIFVLRRWTRT